MIYRQSTIDDYREVWQIICDAKRIMAAKGRSQWTEEYPSPAIIEADLLSGYACVACADGGGVAAFACITPRPEPVYAALDGRWLTDGAYTVVHRLAVGAPFRGMGLARGMMLHAEKVSLGRGIHSIKVDTNHDNAEMLGLLRSLGYRRCGTVSYGPRGGRIAFEKVF